MNDNKNKKILNRKLDKIYKIYFIVLALIFTILAILKVFKWNSGNVESIRENKETVTKISEKVETKKETLIESTSEIDSLINSNHNKMDGKILNQYTTTDLNSSEVQNRVSNLPKSLKEKAEKYPETLYTMIRYQDVVNIPKDRSIENDYKNSRNYDRKVKLNYLSQWDERWGFDKVDNEYIAVSGCGPTSLTMIYSGLTGDNSFNPLQMAQRLFEQGLYTGENGGTYGLFVEGAQSLGLKSNEIYKDEETLKSTLDDGKVIVALVREYGIGDFTTGGHYIVITEYDDNDMLSLYDVNSYENTNKKWNIERVLAQTHILYAVWK